MLSSTQVFVPANAGFAVSQIAEDLFDYYTSGGDQLVEIESQEELQKLLTPEVCQKYVNRIYDELDEYEGEDATLERESQILFDTLVEMGLLEGDSE